MIFNHILYSVEFLDAERNENVIGFSMMSVSCNFQLDIYPRVYIILYMLYTPKL